MGLKGELATMGLEDIFQWLAVGKKTGILEIKGASHSKRVSFADGKVSSVWSSDPRDYLGQFLLASNRITEQQLKEALAAQEDENQVLGKILVNRNLISEAEDGFLPGERRQAVAQIPRRDATEFLTEPSR